jgi:hypothetical protein
MRYMQVISIGAALLIGNALVVAQTSAPLPTKLGGSYLYKYRNSWKSAVIPVELSEIAIDGENVRGILSSYRSPAGNCISDNTAFSGTYKDGVLRLKSQPFKSQFADGRPCGGATIEVKLEGGHATGTLMTGSEVSMLDLDAK